ncbi:hypothetical protein pdam_00019264 [Pocillopora damicornis]|uniref:Uncharacterized protein n=1 Tax=Pocillopora damicornis TaxID=46731 RepID=A0A3M6USL9_POCDA|nr:hypothetical protein pdam_00019264 [Pocillopora damicornis]
MAEWQVAPGCLTYCTLEERKADGKILYYEIFKWKMKHAPSKIHHFSDASLDEQMRRDLNSWIRNIDERTSCQRLQILFSFSIPCHEALEHIMKLKGNGYWEFLLQQRGADIVAFDQNTVYPTDMRYTEIMEGDPSILCDYKDRALLLSWPDHAEDCSFSLDCLKYYSGKTIIHIGKLFGETLSSNPWGQTTSRAFQLRLGETFRCVSRVQLPNWPGHMDSLTVWSRAPDVVDCDGADMVFIPLENTRYFGWSGN